MKIHPDWWVSDRLIRVFRFPNFKTALDFVYTLGEVIEDHQHYPIIEISWGKVSVTLWTQEAGVTLEDMTLAQKIDQEYFQLQSKLF